MGMADKREVMEKLNGILVESKGKLLADLTKVLVDAGLWYGDFKFAGDVELDDNDRNADLFVEDGEFDLSSDNPSDWLYTADEIANLKNRKSADRVIELMKMLDEAHQKTKCSKLAFK